MLTTAANQLQVAAALLRNLEQQHPTIEGQLLTIIRVLDILKSVAAVIEQYGESKC